MVSFLGAVARGLRPLSSVSVDDLPEPSAGAEVRAAVRGATSPAGCVDRLGRRYPRGAAADQSSRVICGSESGDERHKTWDERPDLRRHAPARAWSRAAAAASRSSLTVSAT